MAIRMHMPKLASVRGQTLLTDTKPYLFRQSPVVAEMLDDMLTGGTVAWNQLVTPSSQGTVSGVNHTPNADGSVTYNGTTLANGSLQGFNAIATIAGHKYLICPSGSALSQQMSVYTNIGGNAALSTSTIRSETTSASRAVAGRAADSGVTFTNAVLFVMVTDLTQMFGTQIADYVYSLETQTAGDGIAWLKSFGYFTEDYYPYDAGSLLSVKTSGHKVTGKNLVPKGADRSVNGIDFVVNDDGTVTVTGTATSVAFWGVQFSIPAGSYILSGCPSGGDASTYLVSIRDAVGGASVSGVGSDRGSGSAFTLTEELTAYANIRIASGYSAPADGLTFSPMIRLSSADATYEPYTSHTYPLSDIDLRGISKLVNGQIEYDGDTYESSGTVTRKFGIVDLGTLSWDYEPAYNRMSSAGILAVAKAPPQTDVNMVCSKYAVVSSTYGWQHRATEQALAFDTTGYIRVYNSGYTGADTFKTAMSGVYLVYELADSTTETTDAFENPQTAGTTEQYIDERTVPMPVGHVTEYFDMIQKEQIQMHMPTTQPIKMQMPKV